MKHTQSWERLIKIFRIGHATTPAFSESPQWQSSLMRTIRNLEEVSAESLNQFVWRIATGAVATGVICQVYSLSMVSDLGLADLSPLDPSRFLLF